MRFMGRYLRPHKRALILSTLLSVVSTGLGLVQPYFAKVLIDKVFLGDRPDLLVPVLAVLIVLLLLAFATRVSNSYLYTHYSARLLFKMREDLLAHLHKIPLTFFSRSRIGDIYSRIASDMADVQQLWTVTLPHSLFDVLTCLITIAILLWLNWRMALMSFVFLPVGVIMLRSIRPKLTELSRKIAESNADVAHSLFESLSGTSLIRAFGAEDLECRRLRERHADVLQTLLRYQAVGALSGSIPTFFILVNTLVVFGYGGFSVLGGSLSVGELVAFSIYQGRVFGLLQSLMDGFLVIQKSKVSLERVGEIFAIEPQVREDGDLILSDETFRGDIAFHNVSFSYDGGEQVLRELSFQIPGGQTTALVGPSGVGKSTICHLILRLFDPTSGVITLDGTDLKRFSTQWLRSRIALVSQDIFLFHTTIFENIRYARPEASEQDVVEAARAACIHDFILSLPQGYGTVVGDRGVRLSGGQRQRISIARTVLLKPKILLLDEATAFLDTAVEEELRSTLEALMGGRTILVISHHASSIRNAKKIIALGPAGVEYEGPYDGAYELNNAG
ncbi:ABC transporter ATP-binding protein [Desulforhabdus sp. TSK]|uniref:ABC transporter ATP-binding protein n=1 Tax=Desulforhabdus sp. TSK TaxID=2925014 RepID=UPI001FC7E521|nr:ABC transporter ATP-binding protein [Desulforhabdus sp. TSK]GKT09215.1 multidrug ABC transporter ATP-binding protein [Desulforhabdus sp. TSK]